MYNRIGPVPELTIPEMGSYKFYPENNYDAHIAARYTVFDFGKTGTAVKLSQSRVQMSRDLVGLTKTALALHTIRTFYAILFLQKSLTVQNEEIHSLDEHQIMTQKRVDAGTATNFDVLTTQVRFAAAQNQKVEIESALQKQKSALRLLLGLHENALLRIRGEFLQTPVSLSLDSLLEKALKQRIEMIMARDAERTSELQNKLSSLGYWPSLTVNASYGLKNGYIPDLDKMEKNWVAGVRAEVPVFDGGRISRQKAETAASLTAEQAHLNEVERQIRTDVEQAIIEINATQSKIDISEVQLKQAHEAVEIARTQYRIGSVTNLDLLDAETAESAAKLGQIQARIHSGRQCSMSFRNPAWIPSYFKSPMMTAVMMQTSESGPSNL